MSKRQLKCPKCKSSEFLRTGTIKGNYSMFNGGRFTPSDWSEVYCLNPECKRGMWRTKASVYHLPKMKLNP